MNKPNTLIPTAIEAAIIRAQSYNSIPYAKEMVEQLRKEGIILNKDLILMSLANLLPPFRKKFMGQGFMYNGIKQAISLINPSQIIQIGTGFSTLGLNIEIPFIATDLPESINLYSKIIKEINPESQIEFYSLNPFNLANEDEIKDRIENPDKLLFVAESGLNCFYKNQQRIILDLMKKFAEQNSKSASFLTTGFSYRKPKGLIAHLLSKKHPEIQHHFF